MQVSLNRPQMRFIQMPHKFRAYVSGYRGGKTWVGSVARIDHFLRNPGINQGYFAPTYPQIRDIFYPTIVKVCEAMGVSCEIREGNKEVHIYNGGAYIGTIICRSMEKPSAIIGFEIGDALVDEIDTMPKDKAQIAWNRIIARMSATGVGVRNGVDVTTTPEGFRFVYEKFAHNPTESYGLVQASTYDNEMNIPADYIPSLIETYPAELIEAYLNGQFVNLTSGSVYRNYDRARCDSDETIRDKESLFIGQDFNVGEMTSTIFTKRDNGWHCVAELHGLLDTPDVIRVLQEKYAGHKIYMYPDASGKARKSVGASTSDISLLKQAGFIIRAKPSNPLVKDRVLAVNTAFSKGNAWVNSKACPEVSKCLEQQSYDKNGAPDKSSGVDHSNDAFGYVLSYELPIRKPVVQSVAVAGLY